MKKILLVLIAIFSLFSFSLAYSNCDPTLDWDTDWDIWIALDDCMLDSDLVQSMDTEVGGGFWNQIKDWTNNIALYIWLLAVWSIVLWALMMTLSSWDDEKIKKAKDMVKWGMIWFLAVVFAAGIVNLIVKIMYSI